MHRCPVSISPLARACKAAALLLILSGILVLLAHAIAVEDRGGQVAGGAKIEAR